MTPTTASFFLLSSSWALFFASITSAYFRASSAYDIKCMISYFILMLCNNTNNNNDNNNNNNNFLLPFGCRTPAAALEHHLSLLRRSCGATMVVGRNITKRIRIMTSPRAPAPTLLLRLDSPLSYPIYGMCSLYTECDLCTWKNLRLMPGLLLGLGHRLSCPALALSPDPLLRLGLGLSSCLLGLFLTLEDSDQMSAFALSFSFMLICFSPWPTPWPCLCPSGSSSAPGWRLIFRNSEKSVT